MVHPPGGFGLSVQPTASAEPGEIMVHDETVAEPDYAFALSRLPGEDLRHTPIGVFRSVARPAYDDLVRTQLETARAKLAGDAQTELTALLNSGDTWTIV